MLKTIVANRSTGSRMPAGSAAPTGTCRQPVAWTARTAGDGSRLPAGAPRGACLLHHAAAFAVLLSAASIATAREPLRLLVYEGYADPAWVALFEKQHDVEVKVTYVGGVDEQIAKLKASRGRDYDVVAIDTASLATFVAQKLVRPLDREACASTIARLDPEFRDLTRQTVDGAIYGLPLAWGSLGLVYDARTFPSPPESWEVLWDPKYRGRVISLDDANNNVNFAAIALGIPDPFNLNDDQFARVKRKLVDLRKNLLTYYAGFDEGTTIWAENDIVLMFAMGELNAIALQRKGFKVGYTVPKEGAVGWLDNLCISAGSPRPEAARLWIDFMLQPRIGADMKRRFGYGSTVVPIPEGSRIDRLKWARNPEDYARRQALWNEVKASMP